MFKVILIRGSEPVKIWEHDNEKGARRRAYALAKLHNCYVKEGRVGETLIVDASGWYR